MISSLCDGISEKKKWTVEYPEYWDQSFVSPHTPTNFLYQTLHQMINYCHDDEDKSSDIVREPSMSEDSGYDTDSHRENLTIWFEI